MDFELFDLEKAELFDLEKAHSVAEAAIFRILEDYSQKTGMLPSEVRLLLFKHVEPDGTVFEIFKGVHLTARVPDKGNIRL